MCAINSSTGVVVVLLPACEETIVSPMRCLVMLSAIPKLKVVKQAPRRRTVVKHRIPVGTVIARRTLVEAKSSARIVISIGAPVYIGDGWDWACPYRIKGFRNTLFGHAYGIDGIQALQLVSLAIRDTLEKTKRKLLWLGDSSWQSGFPKMITGIGIPAFDRHLEDVVEREHRRFPADLKAWQKRAKSRTSPWRIDPRAARS